MSLPSFAQQCTTSSTTCIEVLPPGQALPPSSGGGVWVNSNPASPHPYSFSCQSIGCESSDPDDYDYDVEQEADIQCFGSVIHSPPMTASDVQFQQNYLGALEGAISTGVGALAGLISSALGAPQAAPAIIGVVAGFVSDAVLDLPNTVWCGKQTTITTRSCMGQDLDLLGLGIPDESDFWGPHITIVTTSVTTGPCVDDLHPQNNF